MNTHELAWAAGFFDGEGYVGIRNKTKRNNMNIFLEVSQASANGIPEVLIRFRDAVGGIGTIYGPRQYGPSNWRPIYRCCLTDSKKIEIVTQLLWPYLGSIKREQIRRAIDIYNLDVTNEQPKAQEAA